MAQKKNTVLHIALWLAQAFVAIMFLFAFYAKVIQPAEETAKMMPWVLEQAALAKFTGLVDLLGALGLILPAMLRIRPELTVYAAYGGILLMIAGTVFHVSRGEIDVIGFNFLMLALLSFIAWGRSKKAVILAK